MPKKQKTDKPDEQSARFRAEVERMIAAGELNPTDADEAFGRLMNRLKPINSAANESS